MRRTWWILMAALALVVAGCAGPGQGDGPEPGLEVSDQTAYVFEEGVADRIEVESAQAPEPFVLSVEDPEGEKLGEAGPFEAGELNATPVILDSGLSNETRVQVHVEPEEGGEPLASANATVRVEELRAQFTTNHGNFTVLLFADRAPQTVQNFGNLAEDGFYDGIRFHRVIEDFMNQGGDPLTAEEGNERRWGTGGPGYTIVDEFACRDGTVSTDFQGYDSDQDPCQGHGGLALQHDEAGAMSMANTGEPKTGGSQFFITVRPTPRLDGTHPVFGEVVEGMDVVEQINQVPTDRNDRPREDVVVDEITIEGELPGVTVEKFNQG